MRICKLILALTLALSTGLGMAADGSDKKLAQAREAARKAQAALQQAQQERDTLRQQQAAMTAEKQALDQRLSKAQADARAGQGRQAQQSLALAAAEAELTRVRAALADERVRREKAEAAAAESLAQSEQALQAQRQVTASVSALLEKSVAALARAEAANRALHGLGVQAVDAYTQRTPEAMRTRSEPFLALGAVTLEDEAQKLRQALDAQRVVR
jgi:chromosome segregation ATPase